MHTFCRNVQTYSLAGVNLLRGRIEYYAEKVATFVEALGESYSQVTGLCDKGNLVSNWIGNKGCN